MKQDEGIKWIRDVRRAISEELHNDPREFVRFHKALRSRYRARSEQTAPVEPAQPQAKGQHVTG